MNTKRKKQIIFRANEDEYLFLQKQIKESGLKQQDFLLKAMLNKEILNTDGLKEVAYELKKIGNNINQISKALNSKTENDLQEIELIKKELTEIWQSLKRFHQELV